MTDNKYTKKITVQNDSVLIVGPSSGYYSHEDDAIHIARGDMSYSDFGTINPLPQKDETLILIHERQHQINAHKGAYDHNMSLNEAYNRNVHDEITALIAETLEIRRQYQAAKTPEERETILAKFEKDESHKEYIAAIRSGKINPNSTSSKDFREEMTFIKDAATRYRADPNDDGYRAQWTNIAIQHLAENGNSAQPNPEGFAADVRKMYVIGGFDFNTVGNQDLMLIQNPNIIAADNMLAQNADPQKLTHFMQNSDGPYALAETLDITGLSKEQAEKVILTAIITQNNALGIAEQLCLGNPPKMNFNNGEYDSMARYLREQIAPYMDLKENIWENNNMLTPEGNEEKFNQLMQQAQTIKLDPQAWYNLMGSMLRTDTNNIEEIKARIAQYQGKTVNINDVVANMDEFALPFDNVSLAETLDTLAVREQEDAAFRENYQRNHPEEFTPRTSDPYEVEITDLEQNLLGDELQTRKEEEQKVEPLFTTPIKPNTPYQDGKSEIKNPEYTNAELSHLIAPDGSTKDVALLDGKKHGAEITRDAEGNITNFKLYDHGKEIDLSTNTCDYHCDEKDGTKHEYIELNGEKFGAEIITDKNGKTLVAFYEQYGMHIAGTNTATIHKTEGTYSPLREELLSQKGELPNSPISNSQSLRFDMRLNRRQTQTIEPPTDILGRKKEDTTKSPPSIIPYKLNNNSRGD